MKSQIWLIPEPATLVFDNVNEALACTVKMQQIFLQPDHPVPVRVGIHAGEVLYRDDNVFGDSVNLASRIESMGVSGSILLSWYAQQQVKNNSDYQLSSLGKFEFKNIEEPTEVFAVANARLTIPNRKDLKGKLKSPSRLSSHVKI